MELPALSPEAKVMDLRRIFPLCKKIAKLAHVKSRGRSRFLDLRKSILVGEGGLLLRMELLSNPAMLGVVRRAVTGLAE